jgi:hypothetical protein
MRKTLQYWTYRDNYALTLWTSDKKLITHIYLYQTISNQDLYLTKDSILLASAWHSAYHAVDTYSKEWNGQSESFVKLLIYLFGLESLWSAQKWSSGSSPGLLRTHTYKCVQTYVLCNSFLNNDVMENLQSHTNLMKEIWSSLKRKWVQRTMAKMHTKNQSKFYKQRFRDFSGKRKLRKQENRF